MRRRLTRKEFLTEGCSACLCLAAGGLLLHGCAAVPAVDVERTRPPGAPKSFVAKEEEVNPAFYFVKSGIKGVLVRTEKGIVGYENKCSHQGSPSALKDGALVCLWHGSAFDPATGKAIGGPAKEPLRALKLDFKDGLVLLAEAPKRAGGAP